MDDKDLRAKLQFLQDARVDIEPYVAEILAAFNALREERDEVKVKQEAEWVAASETVKALRARVAELDEALVAIRDLGRGHNENDDARWVIWAKGRARSALREQPAESDTGARK